ncbi:hypothetical protein BDW59DRAFT_71664 [Aspergillus cavernicola]|uniref:Uncharacterized protein n=1 Tax=Aspergillus cavernicola TaxID=176166 RepID=A0ABR4ID08_9EURO
MPSHGLKLRDCGRGVFRPTGSCLLPLCSVCMADEIQSMAVDTFYYALIWTQRCRDALFSC